MNKQFLDSIMKFAEYRWKKSTKTSYYWEKGIKLLPNRISCSWESEMSKVARKGRNLQHSIAGQLIAEFTQKEVSPLKRNKPYKVRTQIWQLEDYPQFIGYGTIGITGICGIVDTGDLIILYSPDNNDTIQIYFFSGMGNPNGIQEAFQHLSDLIDF